MNRSDLGHFNPSKSMIVDLLLCYILVFCAHDKKCILVLSGKRKSSVKTSDKTEEFEKVKVTGEDAIPKKGGKGVKRKAKGEPIPGCDRLIMRQQGKGLKGR